MNRLQNTIIENVDSGSVEAKLKEILHIIRKQLDMDVAFISQFIDDRRVFKILDKKSEASSPLCAGDSDHVDESYCQKIVDGELPHIIPDTSLNTITHNLMVTQKLMIGSYIGAPIILQGGQVYGTLCCYKNQADKTLTLRDLSFLTAISEIASTLIEKNITEEVFLRDVSSRIQKVLKSEDVEIHYQPIINLATNEVAGFESLSRFFTLPYRPPNLWFQDAKLVGLGEALEKLAIQKAVKSIGHIKSGAYLSINISPEYVLNGAILKILDKVSIEHIVLEVTEHDPIESYEDFNRILAPLRKAGLRLAIDDAGAGYASFQHILELEPDIIKLDISLIRNIHTNRKRFLLAKALCAFFEINKLYSSC